jgi:hypothetical protein
MLALLAACGNAEMRTEQIQIAPATLPTATPTTSPSAASAQPTATPAASAAAGASKYAGIPQSKTADGYYVLGDPNAPVVLTHYSDFL